jgi:hypothetical protein
VSARMPRAAVAALAGVLLLGVAPALAGCSVVEGVIEQQTGGQVDLGGASVPEDFPAEVPLADGEIVNGSAVTTDAGRAWNILMNVSDPAAPESIAAQLEGAGFLAAEGMGIGGVTEQGGTLAYANTSYVVNVLLGRTDSGWTANYTVARAGG